METVLDTIKQMLTRASVNETDERDTYIDGYCSGLRAALTVVHDAAQLEWESAALSELGKLNGEE